MDKLDIIEELVERNTPTGQIDVAKIMMCIDPLETRGLTLDELRIKEMIGG